MPGLFDDVPITRKPSAGPGLFDDVPLAAKADAGPTDAWDEAKRLGKSAYGGLVNAVGEIVHGGGLMLDASGNAANRQGAATGFITTPTGGLVMIPAAAQAEAQRTANTDAATVSPITDAVAQRLQAHAAAVAPAKRNTAESVAYGAGGFVPGVATGAAGFAAQGYGSAYDEALQRTGDPEMARRAATANALVQGGAGLIPGEKVVAPLLKPVTSRLAGTVVGRVLGGVAERAAGGAAVGGGMQAGSNVVQQQYGGDPTRSVMQGVPEAAASMAIAGPAVHAVMATPQGIRLMQAHFANVKGVDPATVPPFEELHPQDQADVMADPRVQELLRQHGVSPGPASGETSRGFGGQTAADVVGQRLGARDLQARAGTIAQTAAAARAEEAAAESALGAARNEQEVAAATQRRDAARTAREDADQQLADLGQVMGANEMERPTPLNVKTPGFVVPSELTKQMAEAKTRSQKAAIYARIEQARQQWVDDRRASVQGDQQLSATREQLRGAQQAPTDEGYVDPSTLPLRDRPQPPPVIVVNPQGEAQAGVVRQPTPLPEQMQAQGFQGRPPTAAPEGGAAVGRAQRTPSNLPVPVGPARAPPMSDVEIAQARRQMQPPAPQPTTPDRFAAPEGRLPRTPDQGVEQGRAGQAFTLAERQGERVDQGIRDVQPGATTPPVVGPRGPNVAPQRGDRQAGTERGPQQTNVLIHDGFPVDVKGIAKDGTLMVQRYDPRTGEVEPGSRPYSVQPSRLRQATYAVEPRRAQDFAGRANRPPTSPEQPRMAGPGKPRREPTQTFRTTDDVPHAPEGAQFAGQGPIVSPEGPNRPTSPLGGPGRPQTPPQSEGPGPFASEARAEGAQRAKDEAELKARYDQAQKKKAYQEQEQHARANPEGKSTNTPADKDAEGRFPVTAEGYVKSKGGGPIVFPNHVAVAKWITKVGHVEIPDQIFDVANHPTVKKPGETGRKSEAALTVIETGRRAKTAEEEASVPPTGAGEGEASGGSGTPQPEAEPRGLPGPEPHVVKVEEDQQLGGHVGKDYRIRVAHWSDGTFSAEHNVEPGAPPDPTKQRYATRSQAQMAAAAEAADRVPEAERAPFPPPPGPGSKETAGGDDLQAALEAQRVAKTPAEKRAARDQVDLAQGKMAREEIAKQANAKNREAVQKVADGWRELGDEKMAQAVEAGLNLRGPVTDPQRAFQEEKLADAQRRAGGDVPPVDESKQRTLASVLDGSQGDVPDVEAFKKTAPPKAVALIKRVEDRYEAIVRQLNEMGVKVREAHLTDVTTNAGRTAHDLRKELSGLAGVTSRYIKQSEAVRKGYKRGDPNKVIDTRKELEARLEGREAPPNTQPGETDDPLDRMEAEAQREHGPTPAQRTSTGYSTSIRDQGSEAPPAERYAWEANVNGKRTSGAEATKAEAQRAADQETSKVEKLGPKPEPDAMKTWQAADNKAVDAWEAVTEHEDAYGGRDGKGPQSDALRAEARRLTEEAEKLRPPEVVAKATAAEADTKMTPLERYRDGNATYADLSPEDQAVLRKESRDEWYASAKKDEPGLTREAFEQRMDAGMRQFKGMVGEEAKPEAKPAPSEYELRTEYDAASRDRTNAERAVRGATSRGDKSDLHFANIELKDANARFEAARQALGDAGLHMEGEVPTEPAPEKQFRYSESFATREQAQEAIDGTHYKDNPALRGREFRIRELPQPRGETRYAVETEVTPAEVKAENDKQAAAEAKARDNQVRANTTADATAKKMDLPTLEREINRLENKTTTGFGKASEADVALLRAVRRQHEALTRAEAEPVDVGPGKQGEETPKESKSRVETELDQMIDRARELDNQGKSETRLRYEMENADGRKTTFTMKADPELWEGLKQRLMSPKRNIGAAPKGTASNVAPDIAKTMRFGGGEEAMHAVLTPKDKAKLTEHYGDENWANRFRNDVVRAISLGIQSVHQNIRSIVKKAAAAVLALHIALNPHAAAERHGLDIPAAAERQAPRQVPRGQDEGLPVEPEAGPTRAASRRQGRGDDRRPPEGPPSRPMSPEAIRKFKEMPGVQEARSSADKSRASARETSKLLNDAMQQHSGPKLAVAIRQLYDQLMSSNAQAGRLIARSGARRDPETAKAIMDMMDHLGTDPGSGRVIKETWERSWQGRTNEMVNRARSILGEDDRPEFYKQVVDVLRGNRRAVPGSELDRVSRDLRHLFDEQWHYMTRKGMEPGYVRQGYFPRVLDLAKLSAEGGHQRFVEAATKLYQKMGITGPPVYEPGTESQPSGTFAPKSRAEQLARAWLDRAKGISDSAYGGAMAHSDATKGRVLPKEADEIMKEFLNDNIHEVMGDYFRSTSRAAESVNRFGMRGEKIKELRQRMLLSKDAQGNRVYTDRQAKLVEQNIHSSTGYMYASGGQMGHPALSGLTAVAGTLAYLPRATFKSLPEALAIGVRAHDSRIAVSALLDSIREMSGLRQKDDAKATANLLGLLDNVGTEQFLAARAGIDPGSRFARHLTSKFFRANLLTQVTEAQRVVATRVGTALLSRLTSQVATDHALARSAQFMLNDLGIDKETAHALHDLLNGRKGFGLDQLSTQTPLMEAYKTAVRRFVDESIQNPTMADRPAYANHPWGRAAYAIQSFNYSNVKNQLSPAVKGLSRAIDPRTDFGFRDRLRFANAVGALVMSSAAGVGVGWLRDQLTNPQGASERSELQNIVNTFSNMGWTGNYDSLINAYIGGRYAKGTADVLAGPYAGGFGQDISRIGGAAPWAPSNSPETNTAEWNAAKSAYHLGVLPTAMAALSLLPEGSPIARAGIFGMMQLLSAPATARYVADVTEGERTNPPAYAN
jgi:hypothetical protein